MAIGRVRRGQTLRKSGEMGTVMGHEDVRLFGKFGEMATVALRKGQVNAETCRYG